jgi:hypothetical protein
MARTKTRKQAPLPPPLPPETRTVGQLVAETVRLYGADAWRSLALGVGPALLTVGAYEIGWRPALAALGAAYLVVATSSYMGACLLVAKRRPTRQSLWRAFGVGVFIALPVLGLSFGLGVLALAWLALVGLAVPATLIEDLPPRAAIRRGVALGRVDYVHALGSLCALAVVVFLTQGLLFSLLHGASEQATDISAFLAALVVQPILFLGSALLYFDQAARVESRRAGRSDDADVRDADDADDPGAPDAQRAPRPVAGGQP